MQSSISLIDNVLIFFIRLKILWIVNIALIVGIIEIILTRVYGGLPYFTWDLLMWRSAPLNDHVMIWVAMGAVFFLMAYGRGWRPLRTLDDKYAGRFAIAKAFGDILVVYGFEQLLWGCTSVAFDPIRTNLYQFLIQFPTQGIFIVVGVFIAGFSLRKTGQLFLLTIPFYLVWGLIGFPITLEITSLSNLSIIATKWYPVVWINALEVGAWIYMVLAYAYLNRFTYKKVLAKDGT